MQVLIANTTLVCVKIKLMVLSFLERESQDWERLNWLNYYIATTAGFPGVWSLVIVAKASPKGLGGAKAQELTVFDPGVEETSARCIKIVPSRQTVEVHLKTTSSNKPESSPKPIYKLLHSSLSIGVLD